MRRYKLKQFSDIKINDIFSTFTHQRNKTIDYLVVSKRTEICKGKELGGFFEGVDVRYQKRKIPRKMDMVIVEKDEQFCGSPVVFRVANNFLNLERNEVSKKFVDENEIVFGELVPLDKTKFDDLVISLEDGCFYHLGGHTSDTTEIHDIHAYERPIVCSQCLGHFLSKDLVSLKEHYTRNLNQRVDLHHGAWYPILIDDDIKRKD